jgi:hypothetical protein
MPRDRTPTVGVRIWGFDTGPTIREKANETSWI